MTAMKRRKYRKRKETKRKYLQTLCDLKVELEKGTMAIKQNWTKTAMMLPWTLKRNESKINDESYKMI